VVVRLQQNIDVLEVEQGRNFVRCLISNKDNAFKRNLVIIYEAAQLFTKEEFLREFAQLYHEVKLPTLYGGDFNLIRHAREKNILGGMGEVEFF
jgi:hypothetical protein